MNRIIPIALFFVVGMTSSNAVAQEKKSVSFGTPPENTKYTEKTEIIDIDDVPNHSFRIFEIHRTYPNTPPLINGIKMVDSWTRGTSDRIDATGTSIQYVTFVMENGDKVFARMEGFTTSELGKIVVSIAGRITGGTGKFATIQGSVREAVKLDGGLNENRTDIEYSITK
jgi:hypothetical protein